MGRGPRAASGGAPPPCVWPGDGCDGGRVAVSVLGGSVEGASVGEGSCSRLCKAAARARSVLARLRLRVRVKVRVRVRVQGPGQSPGPGPGPGQGQGQA